MACGFHAYGTVVHPDAPREPWLPSRRSWGFAADYYMSPASTNVTSHGDGRLDRSEMRSAQTPQTLFKVSRHFPRYPHLEQMLQLAFDSTT